MSPIKFKPLLAATVMSAIYMAGVPTTAQAIAEVYDSNTSQMQLTARNGGALDYVIPAARKDGTRRYIIQLDKPSTVMGGFGPGPGGVALSSPAAEAYLNGLINDQVNLLGSLNSVLNRTGNNPVEVHNTFQLSFNGLAVYLADHEVALVEGQPNVKQVTLDKDYIIQTDTGPFLIGADQLWEGHGMGAANPDVIFMSGFEELIPQAQGTGVVIGIIDSGINSGHPSFAETDESGYTHTNPLGSGNYLGACDPTNVDQYIASFTCNDKLIGGYDFVHGLQGSGVDVPGPEDENGHGSHTSATAAGNTLSTASWLGVSNILVSGVAPKANVIMYDSCYTNAAGQGLCPGVSTLASVEQAIEDGIVDVLNYSIGGGTSPWSDPTSIAFLSATQAGIFISASAGNSGPGAATLGHVEPWTASVGATTHGRYFSATLTVDTVPAIEYLPGSGPAAAATITADMRYAGDAGDATGCAAWPIGDEFDGEIALIDRGGCPFADKVDFASAAGAVAVIIANNAAGVLRMGGLEATTIPSGSILQSEGTAIKAALAGDVLSADMDPPVRKTDGQADMMADFSSRGPSAYEYNKPDVAAPGVDILAAYTDSGGTEPDYAVISGTSMAAPHNAGAAALLMERNRNWSVAEVKSALMMKAVTAGVMKEDGVTAADPFDMGAGRIQVDNAATATLVLDETATHFAAANPAIGGDLKTLNVASLTDYNCEGTCSFTRTFRSVADTAMTYQASFTGGMTGTVTPSNFTIPKNGFKTLVIEVDATALPYGSASFGQLVISDVPAAQTHTLPITIVAVQPSLGSAIINVLPSTLSYNMATNSSSSKDVYIQNESSATGPLDWTVQSSGAINTLEFEQVNAGTGDGIVSDYFDGAGFGAYSADSFVLNSAAQLDQFYFDGFASGGGNLPTEIDAFTVEVYADNAGEPAGDPETSASALFTLTLAVGDPNLTLTAGGEVTVNVFGAMGSSWSVPAGTYWVSAYANFIGANRWNWYAGTPAVGSSYKAKIIDPDDAFGEGATSWTDIEALVGDPIFAGLAFSISSNYTCGATWLSASPGNATGVPIGGNSVASVTVDTSTLVAGNYSAALCINSNDPSQPTTVVPVSVTVN